MFISSIILGGLPVVIISVIGSLITLPISRWLAKRAHSIEIILSDNPSHKERELYQIVSELAENAGIPTPEVGIYESPDMNAFATGMTPQSSIVAFSTALLEKLNREEIQAVAAHEIGHILSKDVIAMTFLQAIVNTVVLLLTFPLHVIYFCTRNQSNASVLAEWIIWLVKAIVTVMLTSLGSLVTKAFSRRREYRTDAIAAMLVGKEHMISALRTIASDPEKSPLRQNAYAAFKISSSKKITEIFSTHPIIENRVKALELESYIPQQNK